jgi:hypothetical protein
VARLARSPAPTTGGGALRALGRPRASFPAKLMLMEMAQQSAVMKMDMNIAKARHDVEMFILSTGDQGH